MRYRAACCLLPWFIPLAALARPAKLRTPAATAPISVPVNTSWLGADGQTYNLSGTLSLTVSGVTPPPPPPPPVTVGLSYLTMSPGTVTAGQSATVSVILTGAVPAGQTANVILTSADAGVQVPGLLSIAAGKSSGSAVVLTTRGVVAEKLVAISASYNGKGAYSNLRVQPDGVTPPPPVPGLTGFPTIGAYLNGDGSPLTKLIYGQEIRITGQSFGITPGTVTFNGGPLKILAWSDNDVRVLLALPEIKGSAEFTLTRPDGMFHDLMLPLDLPAGVQGSLRRQ